LSVLQDSSRTHVKTSSHASTDLGAKVAFLKDKEIAAFSVF